MMVHLKLRSKNEVVPRAFPGVTGAPYVFDEYDASQSFRISCYLTPLQKEWRCCGNGRSKSCFASRS